MTGAIHSNGAWTGIHIARGDVNVGTSPEIQSELQQVQDQLSVTGSTTENNVYGINIASPGIVNCLNNKIGSITIANADANGCNFYGINKTNSAGTTTISNNTNRKHYPKPTAFWQVHPVQDYAQTVRGIYNAGTGTIIISDNTIANLTNGTTNATAATIGRINGIYSSSGTNTISDNHYSRSDNRQCQ